MDRIDTATWSVCTLSALLVFLTDRRTVEVRGYIYEVLLFFVTVHQHVTVAAKPLLERTMTALVESLTVEALSAFEQVEEFGIGGMLRVGIGIYHHWRLIDASLLWSRRHWKSSLRIRLYYDMCPLKRTRRSLRYMAQYLKRTLGRRRPAAKKTCKESLMVLRKHCMKVAGLPRLSFGASRPRGNRRGPRSPGMGRNGCLSTT